MYIRYYINNITNIHKPVYCRPSQRQAISTKKSYGICAFLLISLNSLVVHQLIFSIIPFSESIIRGKTKLIKFFQIKLVTFYMNAFKPSNLQTLR